jgi:8-oxo-dGTP pyrophosphatase MutT (NUDIX family)
LHAYSIYLAQEKVSSLHKDEILSLLLPAIASHPYLPRDAASATPSAVLVIIHYHSGSPHIFLTKRSSSLKTHGGEISFPGGRFIANDGTLLSTALRETEEEIGISFPPVQIVGSLRAVRTMTSNHFIVPFLTVQEKLPDHKPAPSEVEAVLDAPLIETLRTIAPDVEHYRLAKDAFKFTYQQNTIWGATARIMKQLYDLLIC